MDDDEAFMQLALGNAQDALSPLEIGMHALRAVPLGNGGRGKKGGDSYYAEQIGKSRTYIQQVKQAAEVVQNLQVNLQVLIEKAQHLAHIHKADTSLWDTLVNEMLSRQWSAKDTEAMRPAEFRNHGAARKLTKTRKIPPERIPHVATRI